MITKNESKNIGRCLKSVQSIADEIIVVDTGSTDDTVDIAKSLGALVLEHKWNNDFSAARNVSLDHATKDWVLVLDADEELEPEEAAKIKALIQQPTPLKAFYLRLVNIINETDIGNAIVLRLFINGHDHRFKGKLHEQIINKLQDKYGNDCIGETPYRILHYGYDPNVSNADKKSRRNLDILLSYEEKDKDGYYYYVLGNEYARVDDFDVALLHYKKSLSKTDYKKFTYIYYPYLIMNICKVLSNARRFDEEIQWITDFTKTSPHFKDLYFMETLALIECSKFTEAKKALDHYTHCPQGSYEYPTSNFEGIYNIQDLWMQLIKGAVRKDNHLLDVYIFGKEDMEVCAEAVKSVNEIANKVIVIVPTGFKGDFQSIKNVGGIVEYNDQPMATYKMKNSKAKFILYMEEGEILSFISQQQLVEELETSTEDIFELELYHMPSGRMGEGTRLVRRKKPHNHLQSYLNAVEDGDAEIEPLGIMIHQKI